MAFERSFSSGLAVGIFAILATLPLNLRADPNTWLVYFGTYTGQTSRGIYSARFDTDTGLLSQPQLAIESRNPSFLAVHPSGRFLYAVNENGEFGNKHEGSVSAYAIGPKSGTLTFLNDQPSGGTYPCHLSIDPKGKCVLVANYGSGSVAAFGVDKRGQFNGAKSVSQHQGSSVDPQRQAGPHAHFITMDPGNRYALACDLGLDKVLIYSAKPSLPSLAPTQAYGAPGARGAGPRHLVFHPAGKWVFLVNEMGCTVSSFSYDARQGLLSAELQSVSTIPAGSNTPNSCAEIQIHPTGKFLYASNRGHDSIAAFSVASSTRRLALIGCFPSGGKTPRHFTLDPSGKWLIAENQDSDTVVVHQVDIGTGRLRPTGQVVSVGKPVCAVFVKP
jgi:6-phosphogluconolactonase